MKDAERARPGEGGSTPAGDELFDRIVSDAVVLSELVAAQAEVWTSGAFGLWRDPSLDVDPESVDVEFVAHLAGHGSREAGAVLLAATALDPSVAAPARAAIEASPPVDPPSWAPVVGTAGAAGAWHLRRGRAGSVAVDFAHADGTGHSMLVELHAGMIDAIVFGPPVQELLAADADGRVEAEPVDAVRAAREVAAAWRSTADAGGSDADSIALNELVARARLAALGVTGLPSITGAQVAVAEPLLDPEADAAALVTLAAALGGEPTETDDHRVAACAELVRWSPSTELDPRDTQALSVLEWADWLGAVIGIVRAGGGAVDGDRLVDHVNRCPEVTSSIPARERAYYAAAFDVAVDRWARAGLVDDAGQLVGDATVVLPAALARAWRSGG